MRARDWLADRLPLLIAFAIALGLLLLVAWLRAPSLTAGDAAYVLLLGAVVAAAILAVDGARQRPFRRALRRALEDEAAPLRAAGAFPPARTREGRAYLRLLERRQRRWLEELQAHRERAEAHRTFTDHWVHQMKTPVAVLELTARRALEEEADAGARAAWESVQEEVGRLGAGLETMLSVARLERFELDLVPAATELEPLVRGVANELRSSWIRAGTFPRVLVEAPARVETDPKWLAVVLRQLLGNAIKYGAARADAREVRVRIGRAGDAVVLSVEDDGIGIPEHDLPRVFERFFTGENGRTAGASTGMGLHLVAEICRRLGHGVEIASREGEGTTVRLRFEPRGLHRLAAGDGTERFAPRS